MGRVRLGRIILSDLDHHYSLGLFRVVTVSSTGVFKPLPENFSLSVIYAKNEKWNNDSQDSIINLITVEKVDIIMIVGFLQGISIGF